MSRRLLLAALVALLTVRVAPAQSVDGTLQAIVRDDGGKPLSDAVVSLSPRGATPPVPSGATAVMDQYGKEFVPHVLPVVVGTAVRFPNRDDIRHHVYSFSPAKRFELPLYIGTPASPVVFDRPGVVVLGCNIHDWMIGYVYVLATPYFARTGPDGVARIADVPAGAYEARVWHPRLREATEKTGRAVTIAAGQSGETSFAVALKREWRPPVRRDYDRPQS